MQQSKHERSIAAVVVNQEIRAFLWSDNISYLVERLYYPHFHVCVWISKLKRSYFGSPSIILLVVSFYHFCCKKDNFFCLTHKPDTYRIHLCGLGQWLLQVGGGRARPRHPIIFLSCSLSLFFYCLMCFAESPAGKCVPMCAYVHFMSYPFARLSVMTTGEDTRMTSLSHSPLVENDPQKSKATLFLSLSLSPYSVWSINMWPRIRVLDFSSFSSNQLCSTLEGIHSCTHAANNSCRELVVVVAAAAAAACFGARTRPLSSSSGSR